MAFRAKITYPMKSFSQLYAELDASTSTNVKLEALTRYFSSAPEADAAWAVYFLAGGRPRQTVPTRVLRAAALREANIPEWLFEECYQAVGDLAESIALILPPAQGLSDHGLAFWIESRLLSLRGAAPEASIEALVSYWNELDRSGRFLLTKLIGGGFRVGVSKLLVTRALASVCALDAKLIAQRLMGYTDARHTPTAAAYRALIEPSEHGNGESAPFSGQPYPFFLAHALALDQADFDVTLGAPSQWLIEWKYDGIRGQIVRRAGVVSVWSRGEELVNERFPELCALGAHLPDGCVLDGEILVWRDDMPGPFALLQQRIGRKNLTARVLREAPVAFVAYDLLESDGVDCRPRPLSERRTILEALVEETNQPNRANPAGPASPANQPTLRLSPRVTADTWAELARLRESARSRHVEGFMLKELTSRYGVGRTKEAGVWWKWKVDPLCVDAVLIYAQRGHGRRAQLYTDFTFAVWDQPVGVRERTLVPFAKAYSGLTDEEMRAVDAVIRKTTREKFGPVRSVTPTLVFELGFEGIQRSTRHKSGIAVRFPRMLRWRTDKPVEEADTLGTLETLLSLA